ncbi:hypothetical protein D1AOALGA4SA_9612 [Olavius algarvensis Delta 1 endosymbiont]|nr:hypothetical protein D1AOALGA4SA_9612 [Olavius algarvensis Delta 1 endosymbiont]
MNKAVVAARSYAITALPWRREFHELPATEKWILTRSRLH